MTSTADSAPRRSPTDWGAATAVLTPFVLAATYLLVARGVRLKPFVLGSGSWGVGCALKMLLYQGIVRRLPHAGAALPWVALLNGFLSGVCELGAAVPFLAFLGRMSLDAVVAFGLGIGLFEAWVVMTSGNLLEGTALRAPAAELEAVVDHAAGARRSVYRFLVPLLERVSATGIHVGTRGLMYLALRLGSLWPALLALAVFVVADGVIGYRLLAQGKLARTRTLVAAELALLGVAGVAVLMFIAWWRPQ